MRAGGSRSQVVERILTHLHALRSLYCTIAVAFDESLSHKCLALMVGKFHRDRGGITA